jgi:hypothetical protein
MPLCGLYADAQHFDNGDFAIDLLESYLRVKYPGKGNSIALPKFNTGNFGLYLAHNKNDAAAARAFKDLIHSIESEAAVCKDDESYFQRMTMYKAHVIIAFNSTRIEIYYETDNMVAFVCEDIW